MTVIDSYLETLFSPYPDSPRLRSARAELAAMMEDKLADLQREGLTESQALGRVIAEFGTLDEVAPVLGIEGEVRGTAAASLPEPDPRPRLDVDEVQEYAEAVRRAQPLHALGVALFIASPIPLLGLIAASQDMAEGGRRIAITVGVTVLLVIVALAVLVVTRRGARLKEFGSDPVADELGVTLTAGAQRHLTDLRRTVKARTSLQRGAAIGMFILCPVPIIIPAVLGTDGTWGALGTSSATGVLAGTCITLALVAFGVLLLVRSAWADHVEESLVGEDEDDEYDRLSTTYPVFGVVMAVYWPVMVAIFLAWSFIGDAWGTSWVIWPIAGVLYGALWSGAGVLARSRRDPDGPAER